MGNEEKAGGVVGTDVSVSCEVEENELGRTVGKDGAIFVV